MAEEYDAMAWGLVREEIRNVIKFKDDRPEKIFGDILLPKATSYYGGGFIKDSAQIRLRGRLLGEMRERLSGFHEETGRCRLGETGPHVPLNGMYVWDNPAYGVTEIKTGSHHEEKFLELKHASLAVGKKRLVADWISSFVMLSHHALYRLIQRGAVSREPLKFLSDRLDKWLDYATLFSLAHHHSDGRLGHNAFIPFAEGALLAKIAVTEIKSTKSGWGAHDMRFIDGAKVRRIEPTPYGDIMVTDVDGKPGVTTLQIATWIPMGYLQTEQWWAKLKIQEFMVQYGTMIRSHRAAMCNRHASKEEVEATIAGHDKMFEDLFSILENRRWAVACNWDAK